MFFIYVSFSKVEVLHDLNLEFNAGERCDRPWKWFGKSTLVKLLLTLLWSKQGQMLTDGVSIEACQLSQIYRCSFSKILVARQVMT